MSVAATVVPADTVRRALEHVGIFAGRSGERTLEGAEEFLHTRGYGGAVRRNGDGSIVFVGDAAPAAEMMVELAALARAGQYGGAAATSPRKGRAAPAPPLGGLRGVEETRARMLWWGIGITVALGALAVGVVALNARERRDKKLLGVEAA